MTTPIQIPKSGQVLSQLFGGLAHQSQTRRLSLVCPCQRHSLESKDRRAKPTIVLRYLNGNKADFADLYRSCAKGGFK